MEANKAARTSISANGLLTVAADETLTTLTVRATSTVDTSKSSMATVTVTDPLTSIAGVQAYLSAASGEATAADPESLDVQLNLADTSNGWVALLGAIQTAGKFVALNLSACTISGTEFDLGVANTGESKILSLPNAAVSIKAGYSASVFKNFTALTGVSGSAVETIGNWAFSGCAALTSVSLSATSSIGSGAFAYTGTSGLAVTLGSAAPTLGYNMFGSINGAKAVTVKVPSGATGYGTLPSTYSGSYSTVNWGNGFRGKGWDGSAFISYGSINSYITLTIQA